MGLRTRIHLVAQGKIERQLAGLWTPGRIRSMPLHSNGQIFELTAACRRIASELARDRAGRAARLARYSPHPSAPSHSMATSSRSASERLRLSGKGDDGARCVGGIPPELRNHRARAGAETPAATAASSLESPASISRQNQHRCSRCQTSGRLGENHLLRVERSNFRLPVIINTSNPGVLRRPVESAPFTGATFHGVKLHPTSRP